jgi:hypothetical protein
MIRYWQQESSLAAIKVVMTTEHNRGKDVQVMQKITTSEFIGCIFGEVICGRRKDYHKCEKHTFDLSWPISFHMQHGMDFMYKYYVDTSVYFSPLALVNHSCNPNTHFYTCWMDGCVLLCVYSFRDIPAGSFLSYNYWSDSLKEVAISFPQGYHCGTKECVFPAKI